GGITWTDFDNDGDVDLLVAGVSSQLYRNDGAGVFTPVTGGQLVERGGQAGGANWGDYDNDGFLDLYLPRTDSAQPLPSFLFHNNGDGTFTQVEQSPFTDDIGFSVNASWGDYDNDGWLDLFATEHQNGMNRLYHNSGDGTFTRIISAPIADDVANCTPGIWGDYDRDGFLDLFVATFIRNSASPPNDYLYHNDGNGNAWITIKCVGTRSNRSAIGAKLRVKATIKGKTFWQLREITTGDGWGGIPLEAHFGLGNATNAEMLRIEWPSGTVQEFQNVAAKQYLTITEPAQPPAICSVFSPIGVFNNGFGFEVRGSPGQVAVVEGSTNLLQWFPLQTYRFTSSPQGFLDPTWRESTSRFYRLRPDFSK
ncbi:MAG: CRTAC1 family protein, partial [Pedosphaera parvula]|nr:CRTAC1 family protein [Pedosphaera parvula]